MNAGGFSTKKPAYWASLPNGAPSANRMSRTSPESPTPTFGRLPEERRQRVAAQFLSARFASAAARNSSAGEEKIMSPLWTARGSDKSRSGSRFLTAPPVSRISGSQTKRTRQSL